MTADCYAAGTRCDLIERRPAVGRLAFDSWAIPPDVPGESLWTARDHAMARRVLDHTSPTGRTLVVAGNAHIPTNRTALGIPWAPGCRRNAPGCAASGSSTATGRPTTSAA